uniref:Uncharacterized protein n=1 Tax=Oryza sativa subsp. japonica TaxID=39947 RepID=Q69Q54_ORYSJ|nr:hypothetical protein [Oryza sativa Japonica Group]
MAGRPALCRAEPCLAATCAIRSASGRSGPSIPWAGGGPLVWSRSTVDRPPRAADMRGPLAGAAPSLDDVSPDFGHFIDPRFLEDVAEVSSV